MVYTYQQLQEISATRRAILGNKYIQNNGDIYVGIVGGKLEIMKNADAVVIDDLNRENRPISEVVNEDSKAIDILKKTNLVQIDFGGVPGGNYAELDINNSDVRSDSIILLSIPSSETVDHNFAEHEIAPIKLSYGSIRSGAGFKIRAITEWRLTGKFNVKYSII